MDSLFKIVFSNRVEELLQEFKAKLFESSHPLSKRLVIVPSSAMKAWLMFQLAQESQWGIAAGMEVGFVEPSLNKLFDLVTPPSEVQGFDPSPLELALAIESTLAQLALSFGTMPFAEKKIYQPLMDYLGVHSSKPTLNLRWGKRAGALAVTLAKHFRDYGRYGEALLTSWDPTQWQVALWQKMESIFHPWEYPLRKFERPIQTDFGISDLQVHVFGLSYLAPVHHQFLLRVAEVLPVNYYLLTPCQKFWSDLLSDKESMRLKNYWHRKGASSLQQEQLEDYLRDSNPLLANFGSVGREMARQLEDSEAWIEERFSLPAKIFQHESYQEGYSPDIIQERVDGSITLLEAIQADLTLLRNPEHSPISFENYDLTIQVHAAPKPMREVEVIYDTILGIIQRHSQSEDPIHPGEIMVMATDLNKYEPYIKTVFGSQESQLDIQLMDLYVPAKNGYVQAFLHMINLPLGRWDSASLMRLFEFKAFQKRHHFQPEDLIAIKKWIKQGLIRWGKDAAHRNDLLNQAHCERGMVEGSDHGTWEEGLGRLLEGLAIQRDEGGNFAPLELANGQQSELLGNLVFLLRSLLADLQPLVDQTKFTIGEWCHYLKCLGETYLSPFVDGEANEGANAIAEQLTAFRQVHVELQNVPFAFYTLRRHLEEGLRNQTTIYRESNLQAVRFCSLQPMRAVPAKVIILMGMGDAEFPRKDTASSLNLLMHTTQGKYYPKQGDFDRYLFLEALLSARCYFVASYVSQIQGSPQEQGPSTVVKELLSYIDKSYSCASGNLKNLCFTKHPLFGFDKRYFQGEGRFKSYIQRHYDEATAFYHVDKKLPHNFLPVFDKPMEASHSLKDLVIGLSELRTFTKNPLKTYFNKTLGIYIDKEEDRHLKQEEDLVVSKIDSYLLLKDSLKKGSEAILTQAEITGVLPSGPFKGVEKKRLLEDIEKIQGNILSQDIELDKLFSIDFNESFGCLRQTDEGWQMPSIHIEVPKAGIVKLVGRIDHVSKEGLIVFAEDKLEKAIEIWPTWLVFCYLVEKQALGIKPQLIFVRGEKPVIKQPSGISAEILLRRLLEYYFEGVNSPSPLMPECIAPMLAGTHEKVLEFYQGSTNEDFAPIFDPYLKWMRRSSQTSDMASSIENWQPTAQSLFVDMQQAWYPKRSKNQSEVIKSEESP